MRPVLFHLPFGIPIYTYGVMLALSLVVGWYLTLGLCARDPMERDLAGRCYVFTAVSALIGARLLYVVTNLHRFDSLFDLFRVNQGGLVAYGGFLGGFVGSAIFCRFKGMKLLAWADCAVPSLCTGLMITRIGCLMYGCDFGKPWDGSWAIHFPPDSPAFNQQRMEGLLGPNATQSLGVHPTQIYESLNGLTLFGLCLLVRRLRTFSGQVFVAFTMGYAVLRYFVETLRADAQRGSIGPLSTSQLIGVATFTAGAALLAWLLVRYRRDPQGMRLWEAAPAPEPAPTPKKKRKR
jgi:phosphatidylglycerol:prolipoprotein diacylglycerol transferase